MSYTPFWRVDATYPSTVSVFSLYPVPGTKLLSWISLILYPAASASGDKVKRFLASVIYT